ncbi:hypothetical protein DEO72_LG2g2924 [Vigna unguiculata]|uniref:Uncharacterized protein n=1 Tax=Vigna unguiculata TaxID=3917 RepID=A0A4D6L2A9_VIGUN|nr:hypothetical protein DEO72_LG2g2924 [Vigna unguiculata]
MPRSSVEQRKAELLPRHNKGKDVKRVRAALLGTGSTSGVESASGEKGPESGLIELSEISVRKDITINLSDTIVNSIDSMDADHIVRTMVEFGSKALIFSRRVRSLYRREVKEGGWEKDVDKTDSKFDVNKDVVDGKLVQEDKGSANEEAVEEEKKAGDAEEVAPVAAE